MTINRFYFEMMGNYIVIYCVNFDERYMAETLVRQVFIPLTSRIITDVTEIDGRTQLNNLMLLLENTALISINRFVDEPMASDGAIQAEKVVSDLGPQKASKMRMAEFFWLSQQMDFESLINYVAQYTGVTMISAQPVKPIEPPLKA